MKVEIRVYNHSAVSPEILAHAEREAAGIFQKIGVETAWLVCPVTSEEAVRNRAARCTTHPSN
jgi:hypothetical protein